MPKGFQKGHIQYNTGKTHWKTGHKWSKEVREKMSKTRKGRKHWWGYKISKALTGKKNGMYGKNGSLNPSWKGGVYIEQGYRFIISPKHPFKNNKGYVREQRLVMEKHLGRYLKPSEIVHHINQDTLDNRISNLMLFPNLSAHYTFHKTLERQKNHH